MTDSDWQIAKLVWKSFFNESQANHGKLKNARLALQISTNEMATRLKIKRNAYCEYEKRERAGQVSLKNMKKLAEAMECEFAYTVLPKSGQTFDEEMWEKVLPEAIEKIEKLRPPANWKGRVLANWASRILSDAKFRRENKLSKRKGPDRHNY